MLVDLQQGQVEQLLQIVNRTQISGADAQAVLQLQVALSNALKEVVLDDEEKKPKEDK